MPSGRHMAQKLRDLGHEVLAVDKDEERVNAALSYVTNAQIGDSTNAQFIGSLGVRNFDLCVVAIGDSFQSSLETTALLKEYGAPFVLSRATRDVHAKFLLRNGADEIVYPEKQMASWAWIKLQSCRRPVHFFYPSWPNTAFSADCHRQERSFPFTNGHLYCFSIFIYGKKPHCMVAMWLL